MTLSRFLHVNCKWHYFSLFNSWVVLNAGGEGDDRGWDGWMASPTRWTWVWASSESWWWTGKPRVLRSMGSQRVEHDWPTELNWKFHRIYVPRLLYPSLCQWTFRLHPCLLLLWTAQCYVTAWMGGDFGEEWIPLCVWLSPFSIHLKLSQPCLLISYTPVQNKKKFFNPFTVTLRIQPKLSTMAYKTLQQLVSV